MNPEPKGYIAKVRQWDRTDRNEIIDYMVEEGTGLTRPQSIAYFEKLMEAFAHFIELKGGVTTPFFRIQTTISGTFINSMDTFDPERHHINLRISPGPQLKKLKSRLALTKENPTKHTPNPELFIDNASETTNKLASAQGVATLKGENLIFDRNDLEQGIFFVPDCSQKVKIRANNYISIKSTEIIFFIPPLPSGNYTLLIQAIMKGHKSIRGGVLEYVITVC